MSFAECIEEYRQQLRIGLVPKAYRGLMKFMMDLRTYFESRYPDHFVSGSLYFGDMDMTYFSFVPMSLRKRKLKVAIVLIHENCHFQAWLVGYNKQVQQKYWQLIQDSGWKKYPIVETIQGANAIIEHTLVADPDFNDFDSLTKQIEVSTLEFMAGVEDFLSLQPDPP